MLWILTFEFAVVCLVCWVMAALEKLKLMEFAHVPAITSIVLNANNWILLCLIPWLVYSIALSRGKRLNNKTLFIYSCSIIFATLLLVGVTVTACVLPNIALK